VKALGGAAGALRVCGSTRGEAGVAPGPSRKK